MDVPPTRRIVVLGKTGAGKSSLGNTLFGETMFQMSHSPLSETSICQTESKLIDKRLITFIDTPGFFDTSRSEEDMKPSILQCIVECAPGPHAFILVLKVEKFTDHEKAVIQNIFQYFSAEVLRYATILFTHGDQLPEDMKIEEFVNQSECLVELVEKCGGRCHVIDNKYWDNEPKNEYRSNKFQVEQLLKTIDNIVMENKGGYYTNELLQAVEAEIQNEEERIRQASGTMSPEEAREKAKSAVHKQYMAKFARIAGKGLLIAAMLGGFEIAGIILLAIKGVGAIKQAVGKKRRAKYTVTTEEMARGETVGTVEGKATAQAASTPNESTATKETAAEKGATKAKTAADVFSRLAKFFRTTNANTKYEEVSPSITAEAATLEEEVVEDETEELEGAPTEETETTDVLPTTETEVAAGEEEGETEQLEVEMTQEETISTGEKSAVTAGEAAGGEAMAAQEETSPATTTLKHAGGEEAAAEGTAAVTTVKDAVGGAVLAEGEGTAALTTAVEEEIDGALLSAAEEAANEVALSEAEGADSITAAIEGVAELSVEGVEMEGVEGAAEVVAEAIEGVAQVVDVVAKVVESCCIQ